MWCSLCIDLFPHYSSAYFFISCLVPHNFLLVNFVEKSIRIDENLTKGYWDVKSFKGHCSRRNIHHSVNLSVWFFAGKGFLSIMSLNSCLSLRNKCLLVIVDKAVQNSNAVVLMQESESPSTKCEISKTWCSLHVVSLRLAHELLLCKVFRTLAVIKLQTMKLFSTAKEGLGWYFHHTDKSLNQLAKVYLNFVAWVCRAG